MTLLLKSEHVTIAGGIKARIPLTAVAGRYSRHAKSDYPDPDPGRRSLLASQGPLWGRTTFEVAQGLG